MSAARVDGPTVAELIQAGSALLGLSATTQTTTTAPKKDLAALLDTRLSSYRQLGAKWPAPALGGFSVRPSQTNAGAASTQPHSLQAQTAQAAANFFAQLLTRIERSPSSGPAQPSSPSAAGLPPVFGQRDQQVIKQLAGVLARWGISALVRPGTLPAALSGPGAGAGAPTAAVARFAEVDDVAEARELLADQQRERELETLVKLLLEITLPTAGSSQAHKELAAMVRLQVALPLVGSLVQLGHGGTSDEAEWARTELVKMFARTTPTQVLATLLSLLSASAGAPSTASATRSLRPALSQLLSAQLLRPGGVRGLLIVVVGSEEDVGIRKLEMITRLLIAGGTDSSKTAEERTAYLGVVVPQLLDVLGSTAQASVDSTQNATRNVAPEGVLRAASFVVTHLISRNIATAVDLILATLHAAFTNETADNAPSPLIALLTTSLLISHAPPTSPPSLLLSTVVTSIIPALFSLDAFLRAGHAPGITVLGESSAKGKAKEGKDDQIKDELSAVLETWAKSVPVDEAVRAIGKAVELLEGSDATATVEWTRSGSGEIRVSQKRGEGRGEETELEFEPERLVSWLELVGRKELSGALFVRWLDELQVLRSTTGLEAAQRSVSRLQLVLKMVQDMGADVLNQEPSHIISFVAHALEINQPKATGVETSTPASEPAGKKEGASITLADLRIVEEEAAQAEPEAVDEDEEGLGLGGDEMVVTGLTLLLAVLEGHAQLNTANTPLLGLIFDRLSSLSANSRSELVPPLAQEARMVLSARQASSLASNPKTSDAADDPLAPSRATYQNALVLLQDALLPVRAQGLAQLKQLVESNDALLQTDPALIPAILDIFLHAIEDDDSFLYLSAAQGLSGLVDTQGVGIVRRLVRVYAGSVDVSGALMRVRETGEGEKGRRELERRLRVGEALGQVVARAGESLARFVNDLIPALLATLREHSLPTTLRASALTLLAQSLETAPLALPEYADDLAEACLTLLSLESIPLKAKVAPIPDEDLPLGKDGKPRKAEETPNPTASDAKSQPSLRRAAALLLGLLFRSAARLDEEELEKREDQANEVQVEGLLGGALRMPTGRKIEISAGGFDGAKKRRGLISEVGQEQQEAGWQGLVRVQTKQRAQSVLDFIRQTDEDSLVRHQAGEVLSELGVAEKDPASLIRFV